MTRTIMERERKVYDRTITVNLPKWIMEEVPQYNNNFSEFAREAVQEYLEIMKENYNKVPGFKILTISLNETIQKKLNKIVLEKREISRCEIVREALKYKLTLEKKEQLPLEYDPNKYILVPNGDGTSTIKTLIKRLE